MYYARYLGLEMRYEAGICTIVISMNRALAECDFGKNVTAPLAKKNVICTIVISMNRAFKQCPYSSRLNFDTKS